MLQMTASDGETMRGDPLPMIAVAGAKRLLQEARDSWREAALPVVADSTTGNIRAVLRLA